MNPISFTVIGVPAPGGSKKGFPFRRRDGSLGVNMVDGSKYTKPWQLKVKATAESYYWDAPLEGPLRMEVTFYLPRPKDHFKTQKGKVTTIVKPGKPLYPITTPDLTKLIRAFEDALKGITWKDDSQVVETVARKLFGEPARAEVKILVVE